MDPREHALCKKIVERLEDVLRINVESKSDGSSLQAIRRQFDEDIVVAYLRDHHGLELDISEVFDALHELAEQTYENTPLAFGCILDPGWRIDDWQSVFPGRLLRSKKYRALSDGYKTAYHVSTNGRVMHFISLCTGGDTSGDSRHFFPYWAADLASHSRGECCGIALTKHGDILVFDEGNLTFSYRFGRWQVWNHSSYCSLIRDLIQGGNVTAPVAGKVAKSIYLAALDASFRRKGALFLVLYDSKDCEKVARVEDQIGSAARDEVDQQFDMAIRSHSLQSLPREVLSELASLDGAVVVERNGDLRAYGAVLRPRKQGHLKGTEGSRTKAAIGASNYGAAVKVSSDGEIAVFQGGGEFLSFGSGSK